MSSAADPNPAAPAERSSGDTPASVGELSAPRLRTRGHERAAAAIRLMIEGRVPHALLISGPPGIGKTTLALDLAAGLLCDDPDPTNRPCRACRGCRLVDRGRHPDLHRLGPTGPGDQIRIGNREHPEDGTVRRLTSDLILLPVEGGARVAIVERADRLTDDAQTALLKTLEEPPAGVTIVLCADDEDRLLPTVRSRSARLRLGPVATREVEELLAAAGVADPPLAARLARIAGGRPGAARTLARAPDAVAARDEIARSLLDLLGSPTAVRLAAARDLVSRATDLAVALDRATAAGDGSLGDPVGGPRAGRGKARSGSAAVATIPRPPSADAATDAGGDAGADPAGADTGEPGGARTTAPAAERRRAVAIVVGLWREIARDLLVVVLGAERQVRDPALLDELRIVAGPLGEGGGGARLGSFLGRLDAAGELLEANVRPELVLDTLLLAWPRTAVA